MFLKQLYLFLSILLLTQPACTQSRNTGTITGRAVKIIDGDTFDLLTSDHNTIRIRLHGIDCPERGQDYYKVCRKALGDFCEGKLLKVIIRDKDRYKRTVADVYTSNGNWINQQMIAGGYAWHYTHYDHDQRLAQAMQSARKNNLGLWSLPNPTPPWEWRKERRQQKSGSGGMPRS